MGEFIKDICMVAICGSFATLISPGKKLLKYIKFLVSLCMVCAVVSSVISVSDDIRTYVSDLEIKIEEGAESHDNDVRISIIREAKKNMEKEIMSLLIARYGIEENEVYAVVQINAENADAVEIERINIFLHDTSCADDVRVYVSSLFENSAEVYVMQKG